MGSRTISLILYIENLYYLLFLHKEVSVKVCASTGIGYFRYFSLTVETRTTLNAEQESVLPKHSRDTQWRWNVYHNNNLVKLNVIVRVWVKQLFVQHTLYYIQLLIKTKRAHFKPLSKQQCLYFETYFVTKFTTPTGYHTYIILL